MTVLTEEGCDTQSTAGFPPHLFLSAPDTPVSTGKLLENVVWTGAPSWKIISIVPVIWLQAIARITTVSLGQT